LDKIIIFLQITILKKDKFLFFLSVCG